MILAVAVPENRELVIYGADTLAEQNAFLGRIEGEEPTLLQDTDFGRFFADANLAKFKHPPTILEFPSTEELDAFVAEHQLKLTSFLDAHGMQRQMIERHEFNKSDSRTIGEITGYNDFDPFDRRTDEEKQKEREAREAVKTGKKKGSKGDLTGDSFGGASEGYRPDADENGDMIPPSEEKQRSQIRVREVEFETDAAGDLVPEDPTQPLGPNNLPRVKRAVLDKNFMSSEYWHLTLYRDGQVDNKLASYVELTNIAGMGETNYDLGWDFFAHEKGGIVIMLGGAALFRIEQAMESLTIAKVEQPTGTGRECTLSPMLDEHEGVDPNNPFRISYDTLIDVYFRVEVEGLSVADVNEALQFQGGKPAFKSNDVDDPRLSGSWHAFIRRGDAETALAHLGKQGIIATIVDVDPEGERYLEEGAAAVVLDQGAEKVEEPMPWNERKAEWDAYSDEEREAASKKIKGKQFIFSLKDYGPPTHILVHIQPRSYFAKHEELWTGEMPGLDRLLPDNFEKYGEQAGLYRVNSLDKNTTDFILANKLKMKESLNLRMFLNFADKSAFA